MDKRLCDIYNFALFSENNVPFGLNQSTSFIHLFYYLKCNNYKPWIMSFSSSISL
jgi:hypothetical protein